MSKKQQKNLLAKVRLFNPWYFLIIAFIFGAVSIYALRQNNLKMIELRDKVFAADEAGTDVETALKDLREHVYAHMNTNLTTDNGVKPPIQLKYTYERLVEQQKNASDKTADQIYTDAQKHCEQLYPNSFSGGPRVPCIQQYVSSHTVSQGDSIPDALYKFDFVSPKWSPDLAGWSLVLAVVFLALFAVRFSLERWVKSGLDN